ncbi:nucleotide exchange factor GrpE [Sandarakinorhabdus sp.]|uniref:nucleotide exchange factor GrpE n=1 Tax=Sandarakinorhabdus sp. TaxID=1916663 RepID=UPI0033407FDA
MTDTTDTSESPELAPESAEIADTSPDIDLAEALLAKDQEIADLKDRVLRALADVENTRRRLDRDKIEATAYAVTGFARDMLAVADNLRRAVAALPADGFDGVRAGIEATERELLAIFGRHHVAKLGITAGAALDPNQHQAMIEVPSDLPAGSIVAELASGWTIRDRLLRPAMVSVARAPD